MLYISLAVFNFIRVKSAVALTHNRDNLNKENKSVMKLNFLSSESVKLPFRCHYSQFHSNPKWGGRESTFRSLRELLSCLVSTNATQILQARKQMECDNNKH